MIFYKKPLKRKEVTSLLLITGVCCFFLITPSLSSATGYVSLNNAKNVAPILKNRLSLTPIENTTLWEDLILTLNESVIITNGGQLTIRNSQINFNSTASGFVLENDSTLIIQDSKVESGGYGVSGDTNGTLTMENATFTDFSKDVTKLEGDYKVDIDRSTFHDNAKDIIDLTGLTSQVNITDSEFRDNGKDAVNSLGITLFIDGCQFINHADEAIQLEGDSKLILSNTLISGSIGDGIDLKEFNGQANLNNVTVKSGENDGIDVKDSPDSVITIKNSSFRNNLQNGLESENMGEFSIEGSNFFDNGIRGLELVDIETIKLNESSITFNEGLGIYALNVSVFELQYTNVSNNAEGGVELVNVQSSSAHYNRFTSNGNFALNATGLGDSRSVDAGYNYWGTLNESALPVLGSVNTTPILDSDLQLPIVNTPFSIIGMFFAVISLVIIFSLFKWRSKSIQK